MGIEAKRDYVSKQYGGSWPNKVKNMSDGQVASIYQRMIDKETQKKWDEERARRHAAECQGKGEPSYEK